MRDLGEEKLFFIVFLNLKIWTIFFKFIVVLHVLAVQAANCCKSTKNIRKAIKTNSLT